LSLEYCENRTVVQTIWTSSKSISWRHIRHLRTLQNSLDNRAWWRHQTMDYVALNSVSRIILTWKLVRIPKTFLHLQQRTFCLFFFTEIGQLYAIAGITNRVGICQYVREYSSLSQIEKRGIAGAYKKGCACDVSLLFVWNMQTFS
jgi:uncharacterized protein YerC